MKIIRPENTLTPPPKVETLISDKEIITQEYTIGKDENNEIYQERRIVEITPLEQLMQQVIDENKIKVEITLTKKQYELWNKKGGIKWLKKALNTK